MEPTMELLNEKKRLDTFNLNPIKRPYPIDTRLLAKAGFIYTDNDVKCFLCHLKLDMKNIIGSEDIIKIHKKKSPGCSFAQSLYGFENIQKFKKKPISKVSHRDWAYYSYKEGIIGLIYERKRLESFIEWPINWLSPSNLAADGFYYTRIKDHVACAFCRVNIGEFEKCDTINTIREKHKHKSPNCPFINGHKTDNVPIFLSYFDTSYGYEDRPITYICREDDYIIGIPYQSCSKKEYSTIEKRLASFKKWPDCLVQKPQDLAEAGLYYEGVGDYVRCFQCSGGHCNWEKEDIPWNLHARWRPDCLHLYLKKGIEFIKNENDKALDRDRDEIDRCELLWELDIVKCVVSMGYSINIAKETIKKHVNETGWPYLRLDEYIDDMDQMLIKNPKIMKPEPPSIISHIISETKDAYIQSLRSKIESKFSTTSNDILNATLSHESENTENPTSLEALPETENIENPTSLEALPEAENMECDIEILQTDQDPTEEWMKYISGKHVTDEHRKEETKTPEQKRDNPKCEVCKNKNAKLRRVYKHNETDNGALTRKKKRLDTFSPNPLTSNDNLNATLSHESALPETENIENPTSLESLPEIEDMECDIEILPEIEDMECDIEILQTDQRPTEEWTKNNSGKYVTDKHRREETKTPEQKRDIPKCEVCKIENANVELLSCAHVVVCGCCVIGLTCCPKCHRNIRRKRNPNIF
nr:MAG: baculoviral IAP repeat-containing protein [Marsupenaeus japonicus endogenous nimavirus]